MNLLEEDEQYLNSKQYSWEFVSGPNEGYLIIKDFLLNTTKYSSVKTDLMIRVPPGYNITSLDCFYADPQVKLIDGNNPPAADQLVNLNNRQWQQFSRHFTTTPWRPGVDSIQTVISLARKELQQ